MLDVTILILNYNTTDYTEKCINSIEEKTSSEVDYEIVVVDNNSNDEECNKFKALALSGRVKKVYSSLNLGYSGGLMYGLQFSKPSRNYLILNNDCLFNNDCLSVLCSYMKDNPKAGLLTAQMYNQEGKRIHSFTYFQTLQKMFFGVGLLRLFHPTKYPHRKGIYNEPINVDTIAGSFMFFRSEAFSAIGGLDTRYFLYCEEEDASMRVFKSGYNVCLIPDAQFTHFEGKSTEQNWNIKQEYFISLMQYQKKFFSKITQLVFRLLYAFKVGKKFYKGFRFVSMAWFILKGANPAKSLRYSQKINLTRLELNSLK